MTRETAVQVFVDVPPAGFHRSRVGKNGNQGGSGRPDVLLLQLPQHVHPRHLVAVGAPTNGHARQRREKDTLHLLGEKNNK